MNIMGNGGSANIRRSWYFLILLAMLMVVGCTDHSGSSPQDNGVTITKGITPINSDNGEHYIEGRILVKLKPEALVKLSGGTLHAQSIVLTQSFADRLQNKGVSSINPLTPDGDFKNIISAQALSDSKQLLTVVTDAIEKNPLSQWRSLKLRSGVTVADIIGDIKSDPNVIVAEPDYIVRTNYTPTDNHYSYLWGLNNIGQHYNYKGVQVSGVPGTDVNADQAWDIQQGSPEVIVAVIDTGVDYTHLDLDDNMWINPGNRDLSLVNCTPVGVELNGTQGVDDDCNGYVDDVYGYDFLDRDGDPANDPNALDHAHGTHVAGTIAAEANNGGVVGVAFQSKIMALRFIGSNGGSTSDGAQAIDYARKNGAKIINASWGGGGASTVLYEAIQRAANEGILVVAAAGNSNADTDIALHYPSSYDLPNIVSVMAIHADGSRAGFSNYGSNTVDIAAPGVMTLSTIPEMDCSGVNNFECDAAGKTHYAFFSGTSMATPHVAGVAALIASQNPTLSADGIKQTLLATADVLNVLHPNDPNLPISLSSGTVNAYEALNTGIPAVITVTELETGYVSSISGGQKQYNVTAQWINGNQTPLNFLLNNSDPRISGSFGLSTLTPDNGGMATTTLTVNLAPGMGNGRFPINVSALYNDGQTDKSLLYQASVGVTDIDLSITNISVTPSLGYILGEPVTAQLTVTNTGAADAYSVYLVFYLSDDPNIDTGDYFVQEPNTEFRKINIRAGESKTITTNVRFPYASWNLIAQPGQYYFGAVIDPGDGIIEHDETNNSSVGVPFTLELGNDLVIDNVVAPQMFCGRVSYTVDVTVRNAGYGELERTSAVRLYLSSDSILDTDGPQADTVLQTTNAVINPMQASEVKSVAVKVENFSCDIAPAQDETTPTRFYLFAVADPEDAARERDESNNVYSIATDVRRGRPEIAVTSISGSANVNPGQYWNALIALQNAGTGQVAPTQLEVYLSTDQVLDSQDRLHCSIPINESTNGLGFGQTGYANISCNALIPSSQSTGEYYFIAIADAASILSEINVNDNISVSHSVGVGVVGSTVRPDGVDFTMRAVAAPGSTYGILEDVPLTFTVANDANNTTTSYTQMGFYLSGDTQVSSDDKLLLGGSFSNIKLPGGAVYTNQLTGKVPAITPSGTYYLLGMIDYADIVAEVNESNNTVIGPMINIVKDPDLVISNVSLGQSIVPRGSKLFVANTLSNAGSTYTDNTSFRVGVYLSADAYIEPASDILLDDGSYGINNPYNVLGNFASGGNLVANTEVEIPASLAEGIYYLGVYADVYNNITEGNENNNSLVLSNAYGPIPVEVVSDVDLYIDYFPISGANQRWIQGSGASYILNASVGNNGLSRSYPGTTVHYYLSADAWLTQDDIELGFVNNVVGRPGSSIPARLSIPATLVNNIAPGVYYAIAVVDRADNTQPQGRVIESNELNNSSVASLQIVVLGNLPVAAPGGPYSGQAGQAITFDGSASSDPENDPLTYQWTFGDGASASGVNPSHIYDTEGTYTVTLTVSDSASTSLPATSTVVVSPAIGAGVTLNPIGNKSVSENNTLSFTVTATVNNGVPQLSAAPLPQGATFTDNGNGSGVLVWTPTFEAAGIYDVTFTAAHNSNTAQETIRITVVNQNRAPVAVISGSYTANVGDAITFDGTASNDPDGDTLTYQWNFGDGSSFAIVAAPTHIYSSSGTYVTTLTVSDGSLTSLPVTVSVQVSDVPPIGGTPNFTRIVHWSNESLPINPGSLIYVYWQGDLPSRLAVGGYPNVGIFPVAGKSKVSSKMTSNFQRTAVPNEWRILLYVPSGISPGQYNVRFMANDGSFGPVSRPFSVTTLF